MSVMHFAKWKCQAGTKGSAGDNRGTVFLTFFLCTVSRVEQDSIQCKFNL